MGKTVRIGCYSAFWGDSVHAARQLVEAPDAKLDYLVADYLAEVTMGLLARASKFSGSARKAPGFIGEFATLVLDPLLPAILSQNMKVVTNAGGLDPVGLKMFIEKLAEKKGLKEKIRVAAVYGDDMYDLKDEIKGKYAGGKGFDPLNGQGTAEPVLGETDKLLSLNAYIGAEGIAKALAAGANIVVTGRCVDSASVVGPLAHEFGWSFKPGKDLDAIASASLAGHILECGAQATGGNFTDWKLGAFSENGGWANMGYPIAEFDESADFTITKPAKTGGIVTVNSVGEQMLYEVLDPQNYLLPDVILDLSQVTLEQIGKEKVRVKGAKGKPPTPWLKCTAISTADWKIAGELVIIGAEAREKSKVLGEAIVRRANAIIGARKLAPITEYRIELIGAEQAYGNRGLVNDAREVVMRLSALHQTKAALDVMGQEFYSFATSSAPGFTGLTAGRPRATPNFSTASLLVPRAVVVPKMVVGKSSPIPIPLYEDTCAAPVANSTAITLKHTAPPQDPSPASLSKGKLLLDLCVGRSGDKGDSANVAFIARSPQIYPTVLREVTPELVHSALGHFIEEGGSITRYEVPGIQAVNFVITKCLGGGGLRSLRIDKQGKGYAQLCLSTLRIQESSAKL